MFLCFSQWMGETRYFSFCIYWCVIQKFSFYSSFLFFFSFSKLVTLVILLVYLQILVWYLIPYFLTLLQIQLSPPPLVSELLPLVCYHCGVQVSAIKLRIIITRKTKTSQSSNTHYFLWQNCENSFIQHMNEYSEYTVEEVLMYPQTLTKALITGMVKRNKTNSPSEQIGWWILLLTCFSFLYVHKWIQQTAF